MSGTNETRQVQEQEDVPQEASRAYSHKKKREDSSTIRFATKLGYGVIGAIVGICLCIVGGYAVENYLLPNLNQDREVSIVFERVIARNEMVSASQRYNITEKATSVKKLSTFLGDVDIPFTEKSFWYRYVGTLKAGVNLSTAGFQRDGNNIIVSLQKPSILSNTPDREESGVLEENNNVLNPIEVKDVDAFLKLCQEKSESEAVQGDLLEEAKSNAEENIRGMFNAALGDTYTVEFNWND